VIRQAFHVAGYRLRATFARRWPGYLALVLLIGFVGGLSMGSIAGARRTQSSYPTFLASTNPSDLFFSSFGAGGPAGPQNGPHSLTKANVAHLADVKAVDSDENLLAAPLGRNGVPDLSNVARLNAGGSVDGFGSSQDRLSVVQGHMADPRSVKEFVTTAEGARLLGLRVGQQMRFGVFSVAQLSSPGFGTAAVVPKVRFDATLTGIVVVNDEVVQDDIDGFETEVIFTPALTRRALAD
jgi:hypothetical protein